MVFGNTGTMGISLCATTDVDDLVDELQTTTSTTLSMYCNWEPQWSSETPGPWGSALRNDRDVNDLVDGL